MSCRAFLRVRAGTQACSDCLWGLHPEVCLVTVIISVRTWLVAPICPALCNGTTPQTNRHRLFIFAALVCRLRRYLRQSSLAAALYTSFLSRKATNPKRGHEPRAECAYNPRAEGACFRVGLHTNTAGAFPNAGLRERFVLGRCGRISNSRDVGRF